MSTKKSSSSSSSEEEQKEKATPEFSAKIDGKDLVIRIRMQHAEESGSGKSMVVATTRGNRETDTIVDGKRLFVGVNAYYFTKDKKSKK
jgi:hypothetical protein